MLVYLNGDEHEAGCHIQGDTFVVLDVEKGNHEVELRFRSRSARWSTVYEGPIFKAKFTVAQKAWVPVVVPARFDPVQEHGVTWQVERKGTAIYYSTSVLGGSLLTVLNPDHTPMYKWTHTGLTYEGNIAPDSVLDVLESIRLRTIHYVSRAHNAIAPHIKAEAKPKSGMVECKLHQVFYDTSLGCRDCAALGLRSS